MREKLLMLALVFITNSGLISAYPWTTRPPPTTQSWTTPAGAFGVNLTGKMFTLTNDGGGICLYAPTFNPNSTSWPVTPSYWPDRDRGYATPRPYRYRGYATPRPYRYRGYATTRPYNRYRNPWYNTPPPYYRYRSRWYNTPPPYRNPWYNTPPPYYRYRNRWYNTPPPYYRYRNRWYNTPTPYYRYRNRWYNTPTPYIPDWSTSATLDYDSWTTSYPTILPATAQPAKSVSDLPSTTFPAKTARGVSVCLRLLIDPQRSYQPTLFTLSPSTRPLTLRVYDVGTYALVYSRYSSYNIQMKPNVRFWTRMQPDFWTRLCVTVDSLKSVAQVFNGPDMSVRRKLYTQYVWSGEPVITIPAFDGQVTDIQVWDYPLSYIEVYNYMNKDIFWSNPGNALTWSDISYSPNGGTLLEDAYDNQMGWQIRSQRKKGHHGKGERKSRKFGNKKMLMPMNEGFKWNL